jgi:LysM repeat protein
MNSLQKKELLKNRYVKFLSVAGIIIVFSGCASPKILEDRGTVPPPSLAPSGVEVENGQENTLDVPILPNQEISVSEERITPSGDELSDFPKIEANEIHYVVKKGESFWTISKKFGVGMKELAAYNKMDIKKPLKAGTTLTIPPGGKLLSVAQQQEIAKVRTPSGKETNYTVRPGDSLWVISRRFGSTVKSITDANGISKTSVLKVGQKLYIPNKGAEKPVKAAFKPKNVETAKKNEVKKAEPQNSKLTKEDSALLNDLINSDKKSEATASKAETQSVNFLPHTVKDGDSWDTISEMYGVSIDNLKKANPKVASESKLASGTVINVPEE